MEEIRFKVSPDEEGTRIDKLIAFKLGEGYSRTYAKFLMDNGFVLVGGKEVKPRYLAREGDEVFIELPPPDITDVQPENIPLDIIYEDEWLIVINKPAGMIVHPGAGNKKGTLVSAVLYHCGKLPEADESLRPGIVHRLDKDTSGAIVVAKNERALRSLAKQFQKRVVKKRYVALVKGKVEMDNGVVEAPLGRHATDRKKMSVDLARGRHARTIYHVIQRFKKYTLLQLEPVTGRTHQIRVHMKHFGHPIAGDAQYGIPQGMERQALHAEMLGFTHPDTGKYVEFIAPLPDDLREAIAKAKNE